jgi:DNA modification methylase
MTRYITWLRPKLIITSPPYPGIHVLYHRWQIMGRQETPVPYWIAALNDGQGASYYTFGGRSRLGLIRYFQTLVASFRSLRPVIHPEASIVQLLSFSDTSTQLPTFMQAREQASYQECSPFSSQISSRLWRRVPHRKWYTGCESHWYRNWR